MKRATDTRLRLIIHPTWFHQICEVPVPIAFHQPLKAKSTDTTILDLLAEQQRIALNLELDLLRFRKVSAECAWPVVRCAWCRRLKSSNGEFIEGTPAHSNITDGVCLECKEKFLAGAKEAA